MPHYPFLKCESDAEIKQRIKTHLHLMQKEVDRVQGKADLVDTEKMIHDKHFLECRMARSFQYFSMGIISVERIKSLIQRKAIQPGSGTQVTLDSLQKPAHFRGDYELSCAVAEEKAQQLRITFALSADMCSIPSTQFVQLPRILTPGHPLLASMGICTCTHTHSETHIHINSY